ncbi:hypothetical protein DEDE109153_13300 [Deinococcus deserti]
MLALLTFGCVSAQGVPLHKYEYAYWVPGDKQVVLVTTDKGYTGTPAQWCVLLGQAPTACADFIGQLNALGHHGWYPVSLTPAPGGQIYLYRMVK